MRELAVVVDLLTHEGFQAGLVGGLVLLGVFLVISLLAKKPMIGWGLTMTAIIVYVSTIQYEIDPTASMGLGLVALAGLAADGVNEIRRQALRYARRAVSWSAVGVTVIWFTSLANGSSEQWIALAFPLVVLGLGFAIGAFRAEPTADVLGPMLAVSVVGVWVTIPETDMFTIVVGASLPLALATLPPIKGRALTAGGLALAGVIAWFTIAGGGTRPFSVAGGWAAFGALPVIALLALSGRAPRRRLRVFAVHAVFVVVITWVVDIWESIPVILIAFLVLSAISAWVLVFPAPLERWSRSMLPSAPGPAYRHLAAK